MAECLFCAIVAGEIPATTVLKRTILAFRDINPQAPTHVLVIPKEHYPDVSALAAADGGLLGEVITGVHHVAETEGVSEAGYRVVFNTGATRARPSRTSTGTSSAAGPSPGHPDDRRPARTVQPRTGLIPDNMVLSTLGGRSSGSSRASN